MNLVTPVRGRSGDSAMGMLDQRGVCRSEVYPVAIAAGGVGVGMGPG